MDRHVKMDEFRDRLAALGASPQDAGTVEMIVIRPDWHRLSGVALWPRGVRLWGK